MFNGIFIFRILNHEELSEVINSEELEPLLPAELYEMLEKQFLTYAEVQLSYIINKCLTYLTLISECVQGY